MDKPLGVGNAFKKHQRLLHLVLSTDNVSIHLSAS